MAQNNQNKTQNQNKPQGQQTQEAAEKAAEEAKLKAEQEAAEKAAEEAKLPVDSAKYAKYCDLKFAQLGEAKLKDEQLKELAALETELKGCTGAIAKRTVRAAIKNEHALMVAGIPVTAEIESLVNSEGSAAYYFA